MKAPSADIADRESARLELARNIVVEAGAGTGKTTLLVDRMVFVLLSGEGPCPEVNRLVALTFTEKAAAEIKFRLAQRLHAMCSLIQGLEAQGGEAEAAGRCLADLEERFRRTQTEVLDSAEAALRDLERAQIGTIHSFCAHLLRLYPVEAGVDPEFRVDADGSALEELFDTSWELWLDRELGEDAPRPGPWRSVLEKASLGGLRELALGLMDPRVDLASERSSSAGILRGLARQARAIPDGKPAPRGRILDFLEWAADRFIRTADGVQGDAPSCPCSTAPKWPANWDSSGKAEYERLAALALRVDPAHERLLSDALDLLRPFVASLRESFRRRGWISFDGLLVGARDLLRDEPRVRQELKRRFRVLLIDEFQDTDPLQGEILLFLAEAPEGRAPGWRSVRLEPGKLFVVGDPKQSIYRFRGADIAAVESFTAHMESQGALRCALRTSFRSHPGIVDAVNSVFERIMLPKPGLQPAYLPIEAAPGREPGEATERLQVESLCAEEGRRAEAAWIARWVKEERGARRFRDIALVLRTTTAMGVYLDALRAAGVPYVVEGEKYFYETQEVCDLINLLRAVDDPGDRIALVGVLRSPLAALDDAQILRLAREGRLDYRRKAQGLEGLYGLLRRLHALAGREPLGAVVRAALRETYLIELCSGTYHLEQTAANLLKLGRLAAEACDRGMTLKEFIDLASRSMRELREEGESPLADEDYDAVRVLTIHKAKGLEYPVVILPNLSGKTQGGVRGAAVRVPWTGGSLGLRLAGSANAAMALLEDEEIRRQKEEEVRVLYVAMTRASERLILLGGPSRGGESFSALLDAAGLPARGVAPKEGPCAGAVAPAWAGPDAEALAAAWKMRELRAQTAQSKPVFTSATREEPRPRARGRSSKEMGRLCHEVLEGWDFDPGSLDALVKERAAALERVDLAPDAKRLLEAFRRSAAGRDLARSEILARELPFLYEDGGAVVRGTIDLVYRKGGKLYIGDYKTGRAVAARQRRIYVEAVERSLGMTGVGFRVFRLGGKR
ncbi:MAG: UvrD-helicase domain-containing protein [Elusimicrobiota bacterium]